MYYLRFSSPYEPQSCKKWKDVCGTWFQLSVGVVLVLLAVRREYSNSGTTDEEDLSCVVKINNCYLSTAIVAAASLTVITSSSIKLVQVQDMSGCIDPWINSTDSSVGIGWISAWYECLLYTDLFYISWSEGFYFHSSYFYIIFSFTAGIGS